MPEQLRGIIRSNAHNYAGAASFVDPALALSVPDGLGAFPHPIQFTKGPQSCRFFHVSLDRVAATLPRSETATVEDGSHAAILDRPVEYAAALSDFCERAHFD